MMTHTILYVKDQSISRDFYQSLLAAKPILDVPGMTEFSLSSKHILGLMPESGIKKLLSDKIVDPAQAQGIARAELYFQVESPDQMFELAIEGGAKELSPILDRDWGDRVGYVSDPDGHILAFAQRL